MQITGQQLHEAFLLTSGSGKRWEQLTDGSRDQYHAMAKILATIVDRDQLVEEYTRDWLRDNPWMDQQAARNLAEAGYEQRLREAQAS